MIYIMLLLTILLLIYFTFFAVYNYLYSFASIFPANIKKVSLPPLDKANAPKVAVVIVSFNEKSVLLDTIRACEQLSYPNKVIIVGDDSADQETIDLLNKVAEKYQCCLLFNSDFIDSKNALIYESSEFVLFHRFQNVGFKAGNLKAMEKYLQAKKFDFMYLLDSDWHPQKDAIERCLEVIEGDERVAFVQTKRLCHYGRGNYFERSLALSEEACYFVDLPGRQRWGDMILFSGCCAFFRLSYLYNIGGLRSGHLTEDIDLTNRFYLQGLKGVYLEEVENEGEVPPNYKAFRKQQERWTIGTVRALKDYFFQIIKSDKIDFKTKCGMIRQNAYFTSAIPMEIALIMSVIYVLLFKFRYELNLSDDFSAPALINIYSYLIPLMLVLLFSSILPLIISAFKKKEFLNLIFILPSFWFTLSIIHTYFWANVKGMRNIAHNWFLTPKTNRQKVVVVLKREWKMGLINFITLLFLLYTYYQTYFFSPLAFLISIPYIILWVPALIVGVIKS